ncbi:MAG: sigma-70 family RNA polymerase sigma factor [Armatimonadetes bacterium]|nr:sigma-70 family RNA polymerase sigma factor [Armatimonadota bacterium]
MPNRFQSPGDERSSVKGRNELDSEILQRCRQGDRDAFDQLFRRYQQSIYNFAYRLTGDADEASDITSDAFLRVFNAINTFRGDASFTTWLFRIVTNVFLDEKKRQRVRAHSSLDEYQSDVESGYERQVTDPSPTPSEIVESEERSELIQNAINQLPEYQRVMVVLFHIEGKSYEEISHIMQMPIGTVKSRLNRARLALREIMEPQKELFLP